MPENHQLDLDRYVPALLTFLTNKLSSGASACYRTHFGIGVVEWRVLSMLGVEDRITANRVCQVVGLDKSAVSRALQVLEKDGYVASQVDEKDARRYSVSLTAKGRDLHERVLVAALERERRLLADFSASEVDVLIDLLTRMHGQVEYTNAFVPGED